jgi:hypothetical protein
MKTTVKIDLNLIKRKILELAKTKRELGFEKGKNIEAIKKALTPKLESDILNLDRIMDEYRLSKRTIYRYRAKGLKYAKNSSKGFVLIVRKDLECFLKTDMYDR